MQLFVVKFVSYLGFVGGFLSDYSVSTTNKTEIHDIVEIVLKVTVKILRKWTEQNTIMNVTNISNTSCKHFVTNDFHDNVPITALTPPHFCTCPVTCLKPRPDFQRHMQWVFSLHRLIPILCKDFNSYTVGWKCMSSDIGVMLSDHLPDQV